MKATLNEELRKELDEQIDYYAHRRDIATCDDADLVQVNGDEITIPDTWSADFVLFLKEQIDEMQEEMKEDADAPDYHEYVCVQDILKAFTGESYGIEVEWARRK